MAHNTEHYTQVSLLMEFEIPQEKDILLDNLIT
jgi:hypothetical protein